MPASAAQVTPSAPHNALLCRVGSVVCGLSLEHVIETLRPLPVSPLEGMPPFVSGLSIVRGAPVPVVDLGQLLGIEHASACTRFVLTRAQHRTLALAVDEVIGVRALALSSLAALPSLLGSTSAEFVSQVGALDSHLLMLLEGGRLLPESAWTSLRIGSGPA